MFLVPLLAGVWYLLMAVGVVVDTASSTPFAVALLLIGGALIVSGARMTTGNPSSVRSARRSAVLGLAVAMFPVLLILLSFVFTRDVERLAIASGILWWSGVGIIPAVLVLLTCRTRPDREKQARC